MSTASDTPTKTIFKSKTAWVNALMFIASFLPTVQAWLAENPVGVLAVFAAVNVIVRFVTSGKVTVFSEDDGAGSGGPGFGGGPSMFLIAAAAGVAMAGVPLLSSCSALEDFDVQGQAVYYLEDGSKAGMTFAPDAPPEGFVRVAVRDEDGEIVGFVNLKGSRKVEATK